MTDEAKSQKVPDAPPPDDGVAQDSSFDPLGEIDAAGQIAELNDRILRLQAELENVRRRSAREALDARLYASAPLLTELVSVLDNTERAVAASKDADAKSLVAGFQMVGQSLADILARNGLTKIPALGQSFDPHKHEAIGQAPSATEPPGTVVHVVQEGYQLHDRVLRPTRVIIASPPPDGA
jgi:molecular chaperone GrpE